MPKLLQINVTANQGSTGKIAEQVGRLAISQGWDSWIAYGRGLPQSQSQLIRIGNDLDMRIHGVQSRLLDNHGLASKAVTRHFIEEARRINPDVIHLHNIHGYYLNYPLLFDYLKEWGGPVVWTLHDCWPFTGHCAYFMMSGCEKWTEGCHDCESLRAYPASLLKDGSRRNYELKKNIFTSLGDSLTLVPVSHYVGDYIGRSFFGDTRCEVIHNGIDIDVFKPCAPKEKLVLGVANVWELRKGLFDFYKLRELLPREYKILLVGLTKKQIAGLPDGIDGLSRTENQTELAKLYSKSVALVNPTYEDNYPTVNLEAIACGTPVITYRTGGSPESITPGTGVVIDQGDVRSIADAVLQFERSGLPSVDDCRAYAVAHFDQRDCFKAYLEMYDRLRIRLC